ncbi:hypothetical protein XENOCAPTIV_029204, partial [Xenoophorus captivus]
GDRWLFSVSFLSQQLTLRSFFAGCAKVGGVHFPEELPSVGAPSHVHFDEKLHDSVVMVTLEDDGNFMVKVG